MPQTVTTPTRDTLTFDLQGEGQAVIFVAGAGPHRANDPVTTQTAVLASEQGVTTVVPDRLGRGESPANGLITLDRELEALAALMDAVGGHAVLVGHSSGCAIALAAAARGLPVDGLVLWEPPFGTGSQDAEGWATEFEKLLKSEELEAAFLHYMRDVPPQFVDGWRASGEYPAMVAQTGSLLPDAQALSWVNSGPLADVLSSVDAPTQVLVGAETFPGMAESAASLSAAIEGASLETAAGAHHTWEPEAMAVRLVLFVHAKA